MTDPMNPAMQVFTGFSFRVPAFFHYRSGPVRFAILPKT